jgi:hypothetical protein
MASKKNFQRYPMERLGDVLDQSLQRLDLMAQIEAYGIWPVWDEVVGKPIARNAQPEKIRNGTLFVKVSSPVWMQQLQFMKDLLAEKINQRLRAEVVRNIFFVVGTLTVSEADPDGEPAHAAVESEVKIDEQFLDSIEDPDLREAFRKLLRSYARRKNNL